MQRNDPMLGCEYNWLIRSTPTNGGSPQITLTRSNLFTLGLAMFFFFCVVLQLKSPAEPVAAHDDAVISAQASS